MNVYVRKYDKPTMHTPRSSVVKRYVYREGKVSEIPLTEKLTNRPKDRASRARK